MAGFVRRFTEFPSIETITEIESIDIVDLAPPFPITGVGSGTMMIVGEFEDGPFADGNDADLHTYSGVGPFEIFSSEDLRQKFGGFGFTYGGSPYNNPCARRHLQEFWNGNGFIKLKYLRPKRLIVARADTSVGSVAFNSLACIQSGTGTFRLTVGDLITATSELGGPANSAPLAATVATVLGVGGTYATGFAGGESIGIAIDGGSATTVTFGAGDQLLADVVTRINNTLGYAAASDVGGELQIVGITQGTSGAVVLTDTAPGTLAVLGHAVGTTAGTGNVGDISRVTATEIAAIINGSAALIAIGVSALVTSSGQVRICSDAVGSGTIEVVTTVMATAMAISPLDTTVTAGEHAAGLIPAGTRVRAGANEWVTMQTLSIPEGTAALPVGGPYVVKVRPALDDGSGVSALAGTVTTVVDQPSFGHVAVNNASALSAALTEPAMDAVYETAFDATLDSSKSVREVNHSLCARGSDAMRAKGRQNAIDASECGLFGRKFHTGAPLGFRKDQALTQVATLRSDRVFYSWPGWKVRIPEIAFRGTDGGLGFTVDGVIDVRGDGPLASINARLDPEENPAQATGLIEAFFATEKTDVPLNKNCYIALRANGIAGPRRDRIAGSIYQSGVTSDLTAGLTTQARRKMADYIQDTLGERLIPFSKKLGTLKRKDAIRALIEQFLSELKSEQNQELQRISDFSLDEVSGNSPELEARGIFIVIIRVRTLSSLDTILLQTEIGEGVVTVSAQG